MTIHDYFNLITNRDHEIGDFENVIEEEDYET